MAARLTPLLWVSRVTISYRVCFIQWQFCGQNVAVTSRLLKPIAYCIDTTYGYKDAVRSTGVRDRCTRQARRDACT